VIVIDASSLVKYMLREEGWHLVEKYLYQGVVTLDHAKKEVLNAIWRHHAVRRIIDRELAIEIYRSLEKLVDAKVIIMEREENYIDKAFEIALTHNVTFYDSLYLSQALRWGRLLTSDQLQKQVAEKMNIRTIFI